MTTATTKTGEIAHRVPRTVRRPGGYAFTKFVWLVEDGKDAEGVVDFRPATSSESRHLNAQTACYGGPDHPSYRP